MKSTTKMNVLIALILIIAPIIISLIVSIHFTDKLNTDNDWIGFYGSYSGGIIGGIVALLVSRMQIYAMEKANLTERKLKQIPSLLNIEYDLSSLQKPLESLYTMFNSGSYPDGLSEDVMMSGDISLPILEGNHWLDLKAISDQRIANMIIDFRNHYFEKQKWLACKLGDISSQIVYKRIQLSKLEKIKTRTEKQEAEHREHISNLSKYSLEYEVSKSGKYDAMSDLKKGTSLRKIKELREAIRIAIDEIERLGQ